MLAVIRHALAFLTILPTAPAEPPTPAQMGRLPACYPLAGLAVGLICWPITVLAGLAGLPPEAAAAFLAFLMAALTRGFHLDGLADAADALLSHRPLERKFEILKDSHLGTFGVAAIVVDLVMKVVLLASAAQAGRLAAAVVLFPVWGRLSASVVAVASKNARQVPGLGHHMVRHSRTLDLLAAAALTAAVSAPAGSAALAAAASGLLAGAILVPVWRGSLGGVTGDLLGASVELGELASLTVFAVVAGWSAPA